MDISQKLLNGPIPGENYTTDTRNFPWHRPPQFTNMDDAIEYSIKYILDEERSDGYITLLEVGWSIVDITQMFIMGGIGRGLWTFDFGLLMAGPISHLFVIMARGAEIKYELGIKNPNKLPSAKLFKEMAKDNSDVVEALNKVLEPEEEEAAGTPEAEGQEQPAPAGEQPATQPPSTGLGGMPQPTAGAPSDPQQGVM